MRRTSQSETDKQDFIEFITEGTAIQSMKVSSQENARKKVKAKYDKKIVAYMRGREIARDLPMGVRCSTLEPQCGSTRAAQVPGDFGKS